MIQVAILANKARLAQIQSALGDRASISMS